MDLLTDDEVVQLLSVIEAQRERIAELESRLRLRENPWSEDDRYSDDPALD